MNQVWNETWESQISSWVDRAIADADAGHGVDHVKRVVVNAAHLSRTEQANVDVVMPAAWLHDCVFVPKNSPDRSRASRLAAESASIYLSSINYPAELIPRIYHCIVAHSFSANIACETLEAMVLQDADRLEAVGAIGIARCLMTGGAMRQRLYHPDEPFPLNRQPQDDVQSVDHFFAKLLKLPQTMKTNSGAAMARARTGFMIQFLNQLASELGIDIAHVDAAIRKNCESRAT
ncbi:HD domain-containing protein [Pirellulaceae bacterium SH449]